jgi:ubiquinone/menaquinone biosynthesis C-methylase UbiE
MSAMQAIRSVLDDAFRVPLRDLGEFDAKLAGILCPEPEIGAEKVGITDQFLADAETYHARYSNASHFNHLFKQALAETGILPRPGSTLLDLGSGSGTNTILPCLTLFAECRIVATDLSPDLLRILRHYVVAERLEERVVCVCTDAMRNFFRPQSFDVVVGAAILHHLIDPSEALATAYRALRPGGIGFFFEPFEGLSVLRIAYDLVLDRADRESLPIKPEARQVLEAMRLDWATRAGSDKSAPHFRNMDDKWLFTRSWLSRAARLAGFAEPVIVPHAAHETLFQDYTTITLRLAAGLETESLPDWAWDMIARFDRGFSEEMKRDVLLEGTIVLHKPAHG